MGLGILLYIVGLVLLFAVFPCTWLAVTVLILRRKRRGGQLLNGKAYALAILSGLGFGILTLIVIAILIFLFLYFCVDLSYS